MGQITKGGVDTDPVTEQDRDAYRQAQLQLDKMQIPVLLPTDNPHARLYIAALDGTGNSLFNDESENWSAVARIYDQVERTNPQNVASGYVEGTFTQKGFFRTPEKLLDGRFAHSFDERVETAYYDFCVQARDWLLEDPKAQIRIIGVGFSRGSEEVTALERMIHERGIRDPENAAVVRDHDKRLIQKIQYADRPPLVPPGKTLQAALLFDPVATGVEDEERTLPGSTVSALEIGAMHERRNIFKDNDHLPPGFSEDGRMLNVTVPGAHSDIGNTYDRNGLGVLSFNLGVDFLNRLSDRPYLEKQIVPTDRAQFVIHRSDQHMMGLYGTSSYDKDGVRDRVEDQSPRPGIQRKDPIDPGLAAQVEYRAQAQAINDGIERISSAPQKDAGDHGEGLSRPAPAVERPAPEQSPQSASPPVPKHLEDFRNPGHIEHARYESVLRQINRMEEANDIASGPHSECMAAVWVDELQRNWDFPAIDRFEMRGRDIVAVARWDNIFEPRRELALNADTALSRSVEQMSADWAQRVMPHLGQPQSTPEPPATLGPRRMPEHDLRRPDHTRHGQYETLRDRIEAAYAQAGIVRSDEQLDRATAAVTLDMRKYGLTRADTLFLLRDANGAIQPDGGLTVQQGQYPLMLRSMTPGEVLQQPAEQSFQQLQQVATQQAMGQEQQRQVAAVQQAPMLG